MEGAKTVALYERVSGSKQEKEETVETQEFYLRQTCLQREYRVHGDAYRDLAVTNDTPLPDRPAFQRLLAEAQRGAFEAVLCHTFDRWSRHYEVYVQGYRLLRAVGVELLPLDTVLRFETATDKFLARSMLSSKEYVMDQQLELMWKGRHREAAAGKYPGGPVDYGYCLVPVPPKGSRFALVPETASRVRGWYEAVALDHCSCCQIAETLNQEGVPVPSACRDGGYRGHGSHGTPLGKWRPQMIAKMLHKPVYKGWRMYGATRIELPPVVSEELWDLAQAALLLNKKASSKNAHHEYLLSGKIRCVACDRAAVGRLGAPRAGATREVRYYCPGMQEYRQGIREQDCPLKSFGADDLEAWVWERLLWHLTHPDETLSKIITARGSEEEQRDALLARQESLLSERKRRLRLKDAYAEGLSAQGWALEPEDAERLYQQTVGELRENDAALAAVSRRLSLVGEREAALSTTATHLAHWQRTIRADVSPRSRRHAVTQFVRRVEATRPAADQPPEFRVYWSFEEPAPTGGKGGEVASIDTPMSRRGSINSSFWEPFQPGRRRVRRGPSARRRTFQ